MACKQYQLEFPLEWVSYSQLWQMISTTKGLSSWLNAQISAQQSSEVIFWWSSSEYDVATMSIYKEEGRVCLHWLSQAGVLEFQISHSELTKEITLVIRDECLEEEYQDSVKIWEQQVLRLHHNLGIR